MMSNKLVSVIIPTHSGYENITRAVDSVLNQTYKNIEIFVVDDNGKGTENQIKTANQMKKYEDIKNVTYLVHETNINGSAARNTGIRASNGDYISFLDDDDVFMENNLEEHINALESLSSDFGLSYCGMRVIIPNKSEQVVMPTYDGDVLFDFLCGKIRIGSSIIVVRREAVDYVKGFDETFRRHQDWEFIVRILNKYKAKKLCHIGVNKFNLNRNNAKNPEQYKKNRIYYLEKMEYIINSFDEEMRKKIYDAHYTSIGKEYFKAKDIKSSIYWAKRTSSPFKCSVKYIIDSVAYLKRRYLHKMVH